MESVNVKEKWRPVVGYEGYYEVSNLGKVKRVAPGTRTFVGRLMKHHVGIGGKGYLSVFLSVDGVSKRCYVHRLVLEAFVGKVPKGMQCCHNDGDVTNNSVSNLRWDTAKGNASDRVKHGTELYGEQKPNAKLTEKKVRFIRNYPEVSGAEMAELFGVTRKTISHIRRGKSWKHV